MLSIEKQVLFLLSHVSVIEIRELIQIYEARNYSPQHIRNTLSQLKKAGYVESPGRSTYSITASGRLWLKITNNKPLKSHQTWDNSWYIVMLEIPESRRKIRDLFRSDLFRLGFGLLYSSVYITPWDYTAEVNHLAASYQIEDKITIVKANIIANQITPDKAWDIWHLDTVNGLYRQHKVWLTEELMPAFDALPKDSSPLDIFALFLNLGEHNSELLLADPMLPKAILPNDWLGETVWVDYKMMFEKITNLLPNNSYYSQFTVPTW
jgi:phenylacetic acid degradation operon negative regulatory protein